MRPNAVRLEAGGDDLLSPDRATALGLPISIQPAQGAAFGTPSPYKPIFRHVVEVRECLA